MAELHAVCLVCKNIFNCYCIQIHEYVPSNAFKIRQHYYQGNLDRIFFQGWMDNKIIQLRDITLLFGRTHLNSITPNIIYLSVLKIHTACNPLKYVFLCMAKRVKNNQKKILQKLQRYQNIKSDINSLPYSTYMFHLLWKSHSQKKLGTSECSNRLDYQLAAVLERVHFFTLEVLCVVHFVHGRG